MKVHVTKCHACHAKSRTCHQVPRLPRNVCGGDQPQPARDQYQPSAQCHAPATQSQSPCHQVRASITPLGEPKVPRLPRKMQGQRPGAQAAPERHQTTPERTSGPLESLKCRACHAKCKDKGPEPKQPRNDTKRRQSVHQAPWRA